jgi:hypothetical protein
MCAVAARTKDGMFNHQLCAYITGFCCVQPGNVLRMPALHSWTLIDFGCSSRTGARSRRALQRQRTLRCPAALRSFQAREALSSTRKRVTALRAVRYAKAHT